jgi:hypothetical protein
MIFNLFFKVSPLTPLSSAAISPKNIFEDWITVEGESTFNDLTDDKLIEF